MSEKKYVVGCVYEKPISGGTTQKLVTSIVNAKSSHEALGKFISQVDVSSGWKLSMSTSFCVDSKEKLLENLNQQILES